MLPRGESGLVKQVAQDKMFPPHEQLVPQMASQQHFGGGLLRVHTYAPLPHRVSSRYVCNMASFFGCNQPRNPAMRSSRSSTAIAQPIL
jgi:hypothetical protein